MSRAYFVEANFQPIWLAFHHGRRVTPFLRFLEREWRSLEVWRKLRAVAILQRRPYGWSYWRHKIGWYTCVCTSSIVVRDLFFVGTHRNSSCRLQLQYLASNRAVSRKTASWRAMSNSSDDGDREDQPDTDNLHIYRNIDTERGTCRAILDWAPISRGDRHESVDGNVDRRVPVCVLRGGRGE